MVGKQLNGTSNLDIYKMANKVISELSLDYAQLTAADIGSGKGDFTQQLTSIFARVWMLDSFQAPNSPLNSIFIETDLNDTWNLEDESVDFLFSLEVIEHLENPRHFFREVSRVLAKGAYAFITTPNSHSLSSIITFIAKGEHRAFQKLSYPAHITPILKIDFERISSETGLKTVKYLYSNADTVPRLNIPWPFKGALFSYNYGVLVKKI